jgi:hypothetical protein
VTGADRSGAVTRARGVLDRIPHRCATSFVAAGNGVLPAVGGACGGLVAEFSARRIALTCFATAPSVDE